MIVVRKFLTQWEAMRFIDQDSRKNLLIQKELDGYYYVYNGGE